MGTGAVTRIHDTNPEVQEHLTVAEVALMLRVSRATVYRVVLAGHLTGMRFGRSVRIPRAAVEHYVRGAAPGDKDA